LRVEASAHHAIALIFEPRGQAQRLREILLMQAVDDIVDDDPVEPFDENRVDAVIDEMRRGRTDVSGFPGSS
jgi:hypothetical protein